MTAPTLPIIPADDRDPVTHGALLRRLHEYAAASRVAFTSPRPDASPDARHVSVAQERRLRSYLSRALTAAGVTPGSAQCVRVLVPDLASLPSTRRIHRDAPGAVATALRLLFGLRASRRAQLPGKTGDRLLPNAYRPLLEHVRPNDSFAAQAANHLTVVARAARAAGATDAPATMPPWCAMTAEAAKLNGISAPTLRQAICTYRRLQERATAADPSAPFAPVPDARVARPGARGLLATLARLGADGAHPRATEFLRLAAAGDERAALAAVAPALAADLDTYLDDPRAERKEEHGGVHLTGTTEGVVAKVCNIAATLLAEGDDELLARFDSEMAWTATKAVPTVNRARNAVMARRMATRAAQGLTPATTEVPLMRWIVDRAAARSRALSPTKADRGYTASLRNEAWAIWAVAVAVRGPDLREAEPATWLRMRTAWMELRDYIDGEIAPIATTDRRQKLRAVRAFPAPYVHAFGLPLLAMQARRDLDRARALIARARTINPDLHWRHDDDAARAVAAFANSSLRYLVTAFALWDGLRENNYTYALWGRHVRVVTDTRRGVRVVRTEYTDDPQDPARVKQGKHRTWHLPLGAIDLVVLDGYLELVRAPRLMRRGVSEEDATAPNGRYALFVTDQRHAGGPAAHLSYTQMSQIAFGSGLHWIGVHVLGVDGLPAGFSEVDRAAWKGVFSLHITRDVEASYHYVVRSQVDTACEITLDDPKTLSDTYVQSVWGAAFAEAGFDVRALDAWMDRARRGDRREATDALADPELRVVLPEPAKALLARWAREDRDARRNARGTVAGVAGARSRRKRPGQPQPVRRSASGRQRVGSSAPSGRSASVPV